MASQTAGIQQLLAAEKRAGEKINDARKRKAQRLKQAKQEAQTEIDQIKKEQESKFKDFERQFFGSKESDKEKIQQNTQHTLGQLEQSVNANKQQVIVRILQLTCDIHPELHKNLLLQKEHEALEASN
uniref:V-type proton ATPase subunit G n=1 Tax=Rhabditophanes sp. KR3021 TaxID=114890 RepID=A0AC35TRX6_9BILA